MQVYSDELYHYGVLGMKWGRRKKDVTKNNKESGTILKFKKHKVAKIVSTMIVEIGTQRIANKLLLERLGMGDTPRFIVSHIIGVIGSNSIADVMQDNY